MPSLPGTPLTALLTCPFISMSDRRTEWENGSEQPSTSRTSGSLTTAGYGRVLLYAYPECICWFCDVAARWRIARSWVAQGMDTCLCVGVRTGTLNPIYP